MRRCGNGSCMAGHAPTSMKSEAGYERSARQLDLLHGSPAFVQLVDPVAAGCAAGIAACGRRGRGSAAMNDAPAAPRHPRATPAARIAPLATLPVFHKLAGRKVLLAGDSDAALWKAELLAAAGADLLVLA